MNWLDLRLGDKIPVPEEVKIIDIDGERLLCEWVFNGKKLTAWVHESQINDDKGGGV